MRLTYLNSLEHKLVRRSPFAVQQTQASYDPRTGAYGEKVVEFGGLTFEEILHGLRNTVTG